MDGLGELRIGTCSWKYSSWSGLVYSRPDGINYLAEYARRYPTVEVDQWFWSLFPGDKIRLPDPKDVAEYVSAVPDGFRFTVKAPNSITLTHIHQRKEVPLQENPHFLSTELAARFLDTLDPLRRMLGPVLFQFEYLNRQKMPSQAEFLRRLEAFAATLPKGFQYALEVRNSNYWNVPLLEFLHRAGWLPVLLEGYWMPPAAELFEKWRKDLLGFPAVVIRLHGPNREEIERETGKMWDRIVEPKEAALLAVSKMTRAWLDEGTDVYINVNNHFEGSAPLTIRRLEEFMSAKPPSD